MAKTIGSSVVKKWADAIQNHEGWFPGSRSYRNNNPGNLRVTGDKGVDSGGFGIFSTYEKGRAALEGDLSAKIRKYPSQTIAQIMERYAPSSENDSALYASVVAKALGVSVSTKLSELG
jgi:hypothetical protein